MQKNLKTRRSFLKVSSLTAAASILATGTSSASISNKKGSLKLGLASYSLREFSQEQAIAMTKRVGLDYVCFKSMHLAMDSTVKEQMDAAKRTKDAGINLYGGGVIYMNSKNEVDQAFEYAKNAGMSVIVGVPDHALLEYTNEKIKQYDIKVAIHNHGPGDDNYPSPESIYNKIKGLDPRFGLCMDIGHTQRIGVNPTKAGEQYFSRLFDIHMKDVDKPNSNGKAVEIGRGMINIPKFLNMLVRKRYSGVVGFEYELNAKDPLPGLSESIGYVKGCLDSIA